MNLVIAEKDVLARDIARAICGVDVHAKTPLPLSGNGYTVIAASGHLLELAEPAEVDARYETWCIEDLPIVIEDWPMRPESEYAQRKIDRIAELLQQCDEAIIHAGDADDEGQLIVDEILEHLGVDPSADNVMRVYITDSIAKNIVRAFDRMVPNKECRGAGYAAYARRMGDMCFGVSESRLAALRLNKPRISIGRVQTPTLGLVAMRDLAIKNHEREKFYRLYADCAIAGKSARFEFKPGKEILGDEKRITDRSVLESMRDAHMNSSCEVFTTVKSEYSYAPMPYNMTTISADMAKRYHYTAKQTLDITQSLRDQFNAITYNRSDCEYLTSEHFAEAANVIGIALQNINRGDLPCKFDTPGKAFADDAVKVHHGIIPQEIALDVTMMNEEQRNVYTAIVERYAMQFLAPEASEVSVSVIQVEQGLYEHKVSRVTDKGYTSHFPRKSSDGNAEDGPRPWIAAGSYESVLDEFEITEHETTPPKPYTEGTLILDMASIAKYVDDPEMKAILRKKDEEKASKTEKGGIGTTATRGDIIERLKEVGYIEVIKDKLRATKKGLLFWEALPKEIGTANTTAKWWLIQQQIEAGEADVNAIQRSVAEVFEQHRDSAYSNVYLDEVVGVCPKCGSPVLATGKAYVCSTNRSRKCADGTYELAEGCGFKVTPINGTLIPIVQAQKLLKTGKTDQVQFVSKKTGKPYCASLVLSVDKSVELAFDSRRRSGAQGKTACKKNLERRLRQMAGSNDERPEGR